MMFGGAHVPGCPFYVRAYDLNRIRVTDLQDGVVGQETSFKSQHFHHCRFVTTAMSVLPVYDDFERRSSHPARAFGARPR